MPEVRSGSTPVLPMQMSALGLFSGTKERPKSGQIGALNHQRNRATIFVIDHSASLL